MARQPWELTREMFLSEDEVRSLLSFLIEQEDRASPDLKSTAVTDHVIIETLLFSGLRNSELCRLRVRDLVVNQRRSSLQVTGTPRQDRTVFLPLATGDLLRRYLKEVRPEYLPDNSSIPSESLALILNERGNALDRTTLYRRVVRILTAAGLESRASVQLLRHTYGYVAYKATGGNLLFVQQQLGHAHPMVTAVYSQFVEFDRGQLANTLSSLSVVSVPKPVTLRSAKHLAKKGTKR